MREASTPAPERARTALERNSGIRLVLLVTIIAVASWLFFSNLFHHRTSVTAPPIANARNAELMFMPVAAQTPPPVIRLPSMDAENESDTNSPVIEAAVEPQIDPIESTTATTGVVVRITKPDISFEPRNAPSNRVVAIAKTAPLPRAIAPERLPTADVSIELPPVAGITAAQLDISNMSVISSSAPARDSGATVVRYTTKSPEPDIAPVDSATISAYAAPPQDTASKQPVQHNAELVIIVNKANFKRLVKTDISNIYRDRITRWPSGERILVLNLPLESGERRRFSTAILEMSPLDAATESSNRAITNHIQNEYRTKNSEVVVSYIERHENAIGYVPASAIENNDNVRVVYTIP